MKRYIETEAYVPGRPELIEGVRIGRVVSVDGGGQVLVDFTGNANGPLVARLTSSSGLQILRKAAASGREVLLVFECNDPKKPVIIDVMHSLIDDVSEVSEVVGGERPDDIVVDGERVVLDAEKEIVLRCGKASITLTPAGKVIIRGAYVLSRSSGVNRIQGGSVQIN